MKKDWFDWVALVLTCIGGLAWIFHSFNYDIIELILGINVLTKIVYVFLALAAFYTVYLVVSD